MKFNMDAKFPLGSLSKIAKSSVILNGRHQIYICRDHCSQSKQTIRKIEYLCLQYILQSRTLPRKYISYCHTETFCCDCLLFNCNLFGIFSKAVAGLESLEYFYYVIISQLCIYQYIKPTLLLFL